jgi:hypothetical protein
MTNKQDLSRLKFEDKSHQYWIDKKKTPSVSQIIHLAPVSYGINKFKKRTKGVKVEEDKLRTKMENACEFGTNIHDTVEQYIKDNVSKEEIITKEHKSFKKLLKRREACGTADLKTIDMIWSALETLEKYEIGYLELEQKIYDEDGRYAGTSDLVGVRRKILGSADWKSNQKTWSKFKLYHIPGYTMQQSAYNKPIGGKWGVISHIYSGNNEFLTQSSLDRQFKKFEMLLDLYWNKDKEHHRTICRMWNEGLDLHEIKNATAIPQSQILSIIKRYQIT